MSAVKPDARALFDQIVDATHDRSCEQGTRAVLLVGISISNDDLFVKSGGGITPSTLMSVHTNELNALILHSSANATNSWCRFDMFDWNDFHRMIW